MRHPATHIAPPRGKLGVLLVGLGAVSTTFIAGVHAIRKGLAPPIGSLTQLGTIRLGKRTERRAPPIHEFVPLAKLDDLVFGAWDIFEDDAYQSAVTAGVLDRPLLDQLRPELEEVVPWPAVFDRKYVRRLDGPNVKPGTRRRDLVNELRADIRKFARERGVDRMVMLWCGSTEAFMTPGPAHASMKDFERALDAEDETISPSMLYAYAAITEGIPYANAAPNLCVDTAAFLELANEHHVPIAGKD